MPQIPSLWAEKKSRAGEESWYRDKEVEIKSPAVITGMSDIFQSPISHVEVEEVRERGDLIKVQKSCMDPVKIYPHFRENMSP